MAIHGYDADPADVRERVARLLAGMADDTDPASRYARLSAEQAAVEAYRSELVRLRGAELRAMADRGMSYEQIAAVTNLGGKQRVGQLIGPADA